MPNKIVLKHLAREFNIDPYKLRMTLRANNISTTQGRYSWDENSPSLKTVRKLLTKLLSGSQTTTSTSPENITPSRRVAKTPNN